MCCKRRGTRVAGISLRLETLLHIHISRNTIRENKDTALKAIRGRYRSLTKDTPPPCSDRVSCTAPRASHQDRRDSNPIHIRSAQSLIIMYQAVNYIYTHIIYTHCGKINYSCVDQSSFIDISTNFIPGISGALCDSRFRSSLVCQCMVY